MLKEIAAILKTSEKNAPARMIGLKIGQVCGRCGGCGRYSFNGTHSRCYGCNGAGVLMPAKPAEWSAAIAAAEAAAADGSLDAYIEKLKARQRSKAGMERAFAAWKAMDALNGYGSNWNKLNALPNRDQVVARNRVGVELIDALQKLEDAKGGVDWIEYDRILSAGLAELQKITDELKAEKSAATA